MESDRVEQAMNEWLKGNHLQAEKMLLLEAAAGNGHAAHNLGTLYATGGIGVARDPAKARHWMEVAVATGFEKTIATSPEWFKEDN